MGDDLDHMAEHCINGSATKMCEDLKHLIGQDVQSKNKTMEELFDIQTEFVSIIEFVSEKYGTKDEICSELVHQCYNQYPKCCSIFREYES